MYFLSNVNIFYNSKIFECVSCLWIFFWDNDDIISILRRGQRALSENAKEEKEKKTHWREILAFIQISTLKEMDFWSGLPTEASYVHM